MKDLVLIIKNERRSLLRGLVICFFAVFPFTFLPPILRKGFGLTIIIERFNESILYAAGFALLVVAAAVIHNYNSLVEKKWLFDKPAFKSLDFHGRLDGIGSITRELETLLLGEIDGYFFRLGLLDTESDKPKLEIIPLIDLKNKDAEIKKLKKDHGFRRHYFFGKILLLKKVDLDDPDSIRNLLQNYATILKELGFEPMKIDSALLEED